MKKLLVTATATLACLAAFAQGKVQFANDSLHLIYFSTDGNLRPADASKAGTGVYGGNMPAGVTLVADLYAGTSSSSLALISTTTFNAVSKGRIVNATVDLPAGLPGGTPQTFQVQIRDNSFATASAAAAGLSYAGFSEIFTVIPNTGTAYNSIVNRGTPSFSSWNFGTLDLSTDSGLAGARGAISVGVVPEPASIALCGLGAAALLIFRRRK